MQVEFARLAAVDPRETPQHVCETARARADAHLDAYIRISLEFIPAEIESYQ